MCTPSTREKDSEPCGFADLPTRVIDPEEIPSLSVEEKPFTEINFERFDEFLDYLKFPVLTLSKGTILCHSSQMDRIYKPDKGVILDNIYWWNEYYPGQESYKGGWFTYETSYGGPNFEINFYYELQEDLTLPFIPNYFREKYLESDPKYFSEYQTLSNKIEQLCGIGNGLSIPGMEKKLEEKIKNFLKIIPLYPEDFEIREVILDLEHNISQKQDLPKIYIKLIDEKIAFYRQRRKQMNLPHDSLHHYSTLYKGSHVIEGVEGWQEKGYTALNHPNQSYADQLGIKLAELGFNGYISCDECEIYVTHAAMKRVLTRPLSFSGVLGRGEKVLKLFDKSFDLPDIPLLVTKASKRTDVISDPHYLPLDDFLELLETPNKFT